VAQIKLTWQSKLVLLLVVPFVAASAVLEAHWWAVQAPHVAIWTLGLSLLLGLVVLKLRAATLAAAATGFVITASLMFSTVTFPYEPWHTALLPVLAVAILAHLATRLGRAQKERLGIAEKRRGRSASQVAANLGVAALVSNGLFQSLLTDTNWFARPSLVPMPLIVVGLAALAEAAADTVSSELGQVLSTEPRMITTLRKAAPGTDGAISFGGTLAGVAAAGIVALIGSYAVRGDLFTLLITFAGAVFGLFFDSLLGATLERCGWIGNDMVNFLSTAGAAAFALAIMALLPIV
jgi:uncharacterized protein (TIGR00297 family)